MELTQFTSHKKFDFPCNKQGTLKVLIKIRPLAQSSFLISIDVERLCYFVERWQFLYKFYR